jgi:hypothetical protein
MAATISLPPSAALESAAAELVRSADVKRQGALTKALYDLLTNDAQIVRVSGAYLIPSSSRGGLIHRVDDVQGCSCEAGRSGRTCRHTVALELIEQAQTRVMPALGSRISAARRAQAAAEAAAISAELFG